MTQTAQKTRSMGADNGADDMENEGEGDKAREKRFEETHKR